MSSMNILEVINEALRKVILFEPPTNDKVVCHWPLHKEEFYQFEADMPDAFDHLENNLPDSHEVVKYDLENDPSLHKGYYGRFTVVLGLKDPLGGSVFVDCVFIDPLSPVEIYEQNKTSPKCVECNRYTTRKPVLSSIIFYCNECSG